MMERCHPFLFLKKCHSMDPERHPRPRRTLECCVVIFLQWCAPSWFKPPSILCFLVACVFLMLFFLNILFLLFPIPPLHSSVLRLLLLLHRSLFIFVSGPPHHSPKSPPPKKHGRCGGKRLKGRLKHRPVGRRLHRQAAAEPRY